MMSSHKKEKKFYHSYTENGGNYAMSTTPSLEHKVCYNLVHIWNIQILALFNHAELSISFLSFLEEN